MVHKKLFLCFCILLGVSLFAVAGVLLLSKESTQGTLEKEKSEKISVVTTFYPLADFAAHIGGDDVVVQNLTPVGTEPHDFEPSPQDLVKIEKADLFIYNGAGLETWLSKVPEDVEKNTQTIEATKDISLLPGDPHTWMDPVLAGKELENIKNGFVQADPQHAALYEENEAVYQKKIADLHLDFEKGLSHCSSREIVTSHNAFQYLVKRYNLKVTSLSGFSPDEEPSPKRMAEVADFVHQNKIKYILFESLVSPKISVTIANETGAQTIVFNPLEGLTEKEVSEGKDYISIQKENLAALRTALDCQ